MVYTVYTLKTPATDNLTGVFCALVTTTAVLLAIGLAAVAEPITRELIGLLLLLAVTVACIAESGG